MTEVDIPAVTKLLRMLDKTGAVAWRNPIIHKLSDAKEWLEAYIKEPSHLHQVCVRTRIQIARDSLGGLKLDDYGDDFAVLVKEALEHLEAYFTLINTRSHKKTTFDPV